MVIPIVFGTLGKVPDGLKKGNGRIGNQRKNRGNLNYSQHC